MLATQQRLFELVRTEQAQDPYAFHLGTSRYLLRRGELSHAFEIDWDNDLLQLLREVLVPGVVAGGGAALQQLGDRLAGFLEPALPLTDLEDLTRNGAPLELTIRSQAAELYLLPWELCALPASGRLLGALPHVGFRYAWPDTRTVPAVSLGEGGRILFAWSAAAGDVPHAEHAEALRQACQAGFHPDSEPVVELPNADLDTICAKLKEDGQGHAPYTILHLLCHGVALNASGDVGLALGGPGRTSAVDAEQVRRLLTDFVPSLRAVVLMACRGGDPGAPCSHLGSVAQALHRAGFEAVIASRYPLSVAGSVAATEVLYRHLLVDLDDLAVALRGARARLADRSGSYEWAALQLHAREGDQRLRPVRYCPWPGLAPLDARHRRFFFGREAEIAALVAALDALARRGAPRFVAVLGASGAGKSSLVRAGLIPRRQADDKRVVVMRPGGAPLARLTSRRSESEPALVVVDQLEEIFTQPVGRPNPEGASFVQALWDLAQVPDGPEVVVTLQIDFLDRCCEFALGDGRRLDQVLGEAAHRILLPPMGRDALRRVIEEPARTVGLCCDPAFTGRLLDEIADEPGALPLLAHALYRLWHAGHGEPFDTKVYTDIGGVVGALRQHANEVIDSLEEPEQAIARRILVALVASVPGAPDTRRRRKLDDLCEPGQPDRPAVERIIDRLAEARLVVRGQGGRGGRVEIAHETLIRRWARLRGWLDEDRDKRAALDKLDEWAREHTEHRTLLDASRLGWAIETLRLHGGEARSATLALVQESREALERQAREEAEEKAALQKALRQAEEQRALAERNAEEARRQAAKTRRALIVAVVLLMVSLVFLVVVRSQWRIIGVEKERADQATANEKNTSRTARDALRIAVAERLNGADWLTELTLLAQVEDGPATIPYPQALFDHREPAWRYRGALRNRGPIAERVFSADGHFLTSISSGTLAPEGGNDVRVWALNTETLDQGLPMIDLFDGRSRWTLDSTEGRRFLVHAGGQVQVLDPAGDERVLTWPPGEPVVAADFVPGADACVVLRDDGTLEQRTIHGILLWRSEQHPWKSESFGDPVCMCARPDLARIDLWYSDSVEEGVFSTPIPVGRWMNGRRRWMIGRTGPDPALATSHCCQELPIESPFAGDAQPTDGVQTWVLADGALIAQGAQWPGRLSNLESASGEAHPLANPWLFRELSEHRVTVDSQGTWISTLDDRGSVHLFLTLPPPTPVAPHLGMTPPQVVAMTTSAAAYQRASCERVPPLCPSFRASLAVSERDEEGIVVLGRSDDAPHGWEELAFVAGAFFYPWLSPGERYLAVRSEAGWRWWDLEAPGTPEIDRPGWCREPVQGWLSPSDNTSPDDRVTFYRCGANLHLVRLEDPQAPDPLIVDSDFQIPRLFHAWRGDGAWLLTWDSHQVRLVDLRGQPTLAGAMRRTLDEHGEAGARAAYDDCQFLGSSPGGLVRCRGDGPSGRGAWCYLWRFVNGEPEELAPGSQVLLTSSESHLVITDHEGRVSLYAAATRDPLWASLIEPVEFAAVAFDPVSRRLALGGSDGRLLFWRDGLHRNPVLEQVSERTIRGLDLAPGGDFLLLSDDDRRWRVRRLGDTGFFALPPGAFSGAMFDPDGELAVIRMGWPAGSFDADLTRMEANIRPLAAHCFGDERDNLYSEESKEARRACLAKQGLVLGDDGLVYEDLTAATPTSPTPTSSAPPPAPSAPPAAPASRPSPR
ncbi:MAG: CHAT domain-containing protein [Pseudomonadota bacterium]